MTIPSIGDILMLSQLAWKVGRAFSAGRNSAPTEFRDVETEINSLAKALKLFAEALFADSDDSLLQQTDNETRDGVGTILNSCQRTINELDALLDQYQVIKKHRTIGGFAIERTWSDLVLTQYKTVMWTTEAGTIQDLQHLLRMHMDTVVLTMQALQSKSSSQLKSIVAPMAQRVRSIRSGTGTLAEEIEEVQRIIRDITAHTPKPSVSQDLDYHPPGSPKLKVSHYTSPTLESEPAGATLSPGQSSNQSTPQTLLPQTPSPSITAVPSSPSETATYRPTSPTSITRKRISEFSFGSSTSRYSSSYASSDTATSSGQLSPAQSRTSYLNHQPSKDVSFSTSPTREPGSRPDSSVLPLLPPPAIDLPPNDLASSKHATHPQTEDDISHLHRSSTTETQRARFEKQAFRNAAILCDVRGTLVEYTQKTSSSDSHDVELIQACAECRIAMVRKREPGPDGGPTRIMTSIWAFSDDNTVRMQLEMGDGDVYVPYSSYFSAEKISVTVPCELRFHDVEFGRRPERAVRTGWVNYVFGDAKASALFQNELMGRTLLATYHTCQTLRLHEGLSGAFTYAEQMCGMENLRIWEDNDTSAVIALIHFSAHFRAGYLAFYLNSVGAPIRVKDEGGREVKVKGLRVELGAPRKDSGTGVGGREREREREKEDKKRVISGARIEFESEGEKRGFLELVRRVQGSMVELPDLLGVN